jgi:hypothetical protein
MMPAGSERWFNSAAPNIGAHRATFRLDQDLQHVLDSGWISRNEGPALALRDFADGSASMDLFVVPTISFRFLYGLLIMQHGRRQILWLGGHRAPDGRMDRTPALRVLRLGSTTAIHRP